MMSQDVVNYYTVLVPVIGFIIAQVISYIKLRVHIDQMKNSLNGLGGKIKTLADDVESDHRIIVQRIARIEGYLEAGQRKGCPVTQATSE